MPLCFIDFHLGVLPDHTPGQWIEASALIDGPRAFQFEARLCNRAPSGDLSQYRISSKVEGPFTAPTILALLTLCTMPPFTPTNDSMDIFVHGDRWLTDGALARLIDPSIPIEISPQDIPQRCRAVLFEQLGMAEKAAAALPKGDETGTLDRAPPGTSPDLLLVSSARDVADYGEREVEE